MIKKLQGNVNKPLRRINLRSINELDKYNLDIGKNNTNTIFELPKTSLRVIYYDKNILKKIIKYSDSCCSSWFIYDSD